MPELFHFQFEANLDEFAAVSATGGTIAHTTPGLNGTAGGVLYTITAGNAVIYGAVNQSLSGLTEYRTAWHIDLASFAIATDTHTANLWLPRAGAGDALGILRLRQVSGALNLVVQPLNDGVSPSEVAVPFVGSPAAMEVWVTRESSDGATDGAARFYLVGGSYPDIGELVAEFTGLDNFNTFQATTGFRIGPQVTGGASSLSGMLLLDEWRSRDDATPILFGVSGASQRPNHNIAAIRKSHMLMRRRRDQPRDQRR